jgi:hypothetical protein
VLQSADAGVPLRTQGIVLMRCMQLSKLQAVLMHLLTSEANPSLPRSAEGSTSVAAAGSSHLAWATGTAVADATSAGAAADGNSDEEGGEDGDEVAVPKSVQKANQCLRSVRFPCHCCLRVTRLDVGTCGDS